MDNGVDNVGISGLGGEYIESRKDEGVGWRSFSVHKKLMCFPPAIARQ